MGIDIIRNTIDKDVFKREYVSKGRPVLVQGYASEWRAVQEWNGEYFSNRYGEHYIKTKRFLGGGKIELQNARLADYVGSMASYEASSLLGQEGVLPAYWHDVPIFQMFENLISDVEPFPSGLLPEYYRKNWHKYVQFFMGPAGSVTRLHFDTLRTHNLFFQIRGRKIWTIISPADFERCGRKRWRWFDVDPEAPDLVKFPEYQSVEPITFTIGPGDLLYVPPGTLHHVRSLDATTSFNIDFHTPRSVMNSFQFVNKGMPREVLYYNLISFLGVALKMPESLLFPFYKSYLSYVS
jgi:hypothetical protein